MARLTAERRSSRRAAILSAAQALFAQRGFSATSMADIVVASGMATGTVYRYFDSKDAVVMSVSEAVIGIDLTGDGHGAGPPATVAQAVDLLLAAAGEEQLGQLNSQVWARAMDSAPLRSMIAERHEQVCRWLATTIDGGAGGPTPDARQRAELAICAVSGLQERLACGVPIDQTAFRAGLLNLLAASR